MYVTLSKPTDPTTWKVIKTTSRTVKKQVYIHCCHLSLKPHRLSMCKRKFQDEMIINLLQIQLTQKNFLSLLGTQLILTPSPESDAHKQMQQKHSEM